MTTTTDTKTPETARSVRARCEAAGLPAELTERAVRLGAHERHEARVRATLAHLEEEARALDGTEGARGGDRLRAWAFGSGAPEPDGVQLAALARQLEVEVALAYLDLRGVGGRADAEGLATARMPWACALGSSTLGSGRWQAADGGAYRAAGQTALYRLVRARDRALRLGGWSLSAVGDERGICDLAGAPLPGWDAAAATAVAEAAVEAGAAGAPVVVMGRWISAALVRAAADATTDVGALARAARAVDALARALALEQA